MSDPQSGCLQWQPEQNRVMLLFIIVVLKSPRLLAHVQFMINSTRIASLRKVSIWIAVEVLAVGVIIPRIITTFVVVVVPEPEGVD